MPAGTHTDVTQRGPVLTRLTHTDRMVRKMSGECDECFLLSHCFARAGGDGGGCGAGGKGVAWWCPDKRSLSPSWDLGGFEELPKGGHWLGEE